MRAGAQALTFATVLLAMTPVGSAAAPPRADLTVSSLTTTQAAVPAGGKLKLSDITRNAGKTRAKGSYTAYLLSRDRKKNKGDLSLGRRAVRKLASRKSAKASKTVIVPAITPVGSYYVLACADARGKLKEKSEKNNCRASATRITVQRVAVSSPPVTAAPGGASSTPSPNPPAPTAPAAPTGLAATPGSTGNVNLAWNASSGATTYRVFRRASSGGAETLIATPSGTSYTDTNRGDSQRYYYVVRAVNDVGSSANSAEVSALACVDSLNGNSAGSPGNNGTVASGTSTTYSASICRGDQDWIEVTILNNTSVTVTLTGGTAEPGAPGHVQLSLWESPASNTANAPLRLLAAPGGTSDSSTYPWTPSGNKTFLMRVNGATSTVGNTYMITVAAP